MNRILLDTSGYSAFMRGQVGLHTHIQNADEIYLNPVVLGELLSGFRKGKNRARNEKELSEFLSSPRVILLTIDNETSKRYAAILERLWSKGTPIPTNDLWIASSAMQYGITVLTTDQHFLKIQEILVEYCDIEKV